MFSKKKVDEPPSPTKRTVVVPVHEEKLEELGTLEITKEDIKRLHKKKDTLQHVSTVEYTLYESRFYGKIANTLFENFSEYFIAQFKNLYISLKLSLVKSDIHILSKTYVSAMFLSSFLLFLFTLILTFMSSLVFSVPVLASVLRSIALAFLLSLCCFVFLYFYPAFVAQGRNRAIANDLPFATIHMAAVSGSGAQPIAIFNLVLSTQEYKGLDREIRKIVNYVNLFGYDLLTAMRNVALTTPSKRFRELLTGIIATLETGGDLKNYLNSKADDALTTYRLEREKYVESLATYSDVYTSVLIAAPLLFIVTLAIINLIGGKVLGFDASTLAFIGTFFIIPFLNVAFLLFLNFIQPET